MFATDERCRSLAAWALLLAHAGLIAGCAADRDQKTTQDDIPRPSGASACFYVSSASNWTVLDRSTLIVYAPTKSHAFRVEVGPGASDLRWADNLAFVSRSNRICGRAGDRIVTPRSNTGYSVLDVRRLDQASLEGLLAAYGKLDQPEPVEPGESPGAEIERELGTADADSAQESVITQDEEQSEVTQ